MSVRHIHAKPNEYIAVHRDGFARPSRSSSGESDFFGCLFLLGIAYIFYIVAALVEAVVNFVASYWAVLLGGIALILFLVFCGPPVCKYLWNKITRKRPTPETPAEVEAVPAQIEIEEDDPACHPYGKIIQKRRKTYNRGGNQQ
ncbi:MAG: hypothetical protein IJS14_15335 [Lentisphaeria bacterium]|nr:hypothetical protein [Lentisphaeria bacterium]